MCPGSYRVNLSSSDSCAGHGPTLATVQAGKLSSDAVRIGSLRFPQRPRHAHSRLHATDL